MELVKPTVTYKESFIEAMKELQAEGRKEDLDIPAVEKDFEKYISKFTDEEQGVHLPEGYVAHSRYWLVENGEFIGHVDIRHTLTDHLLKAGGHIGYTIRPSKRRMGYGTKILELALPEVKNLGIKRVLITCNDTNIGSAKIIEKNGGILENKIESGGELKRRYWIDNF